MVDCSVCRKWHCTNPPLPPHQVRQRCVLGLRWNWWVQQHRFNVPDAAYHAASDFDLVKPNAWKPAAGEPATGNLSPQRKTMEPPTIKPKTVNRQKTNWKPTNSEAASRQTKSRWTRWTRSHQRFAMVVVTKRWAVSRLEDTKPSTIGINWREQEGAYKKG